MSEIPLILGVGLGGIGLGTIIAAGYLYSNKDKEQLQNAVTDVAQGINEDLSEQEKRARDSARRQAAEIKDSERRRKIEEENVKRYNIEKAEKDAKLPQLEQLYRNIYTFDEELKPINQQIDNPSTPQQDKKNLERRRAEILVAANSLNKKIKKYPENLRQEAKNRLSNERETISRASYVREPEEDPLSEEEEEEDPLSEEENKTPDEDLIMRSDSFSSNSSTGGSKYFTLTYTPKKLIKKCKSKCNKINNRKSKRNKINKIKTKRNKK